MKMKWPFGTFQAMFQQHRDLCEGKQEAQRHKDPELGPEPALEAQLQAQHFVEAGHEEEENAPVARQLEPSLAAQSFESCLEQDLE